MLQFVNSNPIPFQINNYVTVKFSYSDISTGQRATGYHLNLSQNGQAIDGLPQGYNNCSHLG